MAAKNSEEAGPLKESLEEDADDSLGITSKDFDPMRVIYGPSLGTTNENIEVYKSVLQFMQGVNVEEFEDPPPPFPPSSSISTPLSMVDSTNESMVCESFEIHNSTTQVTQASGCIYGDPANVTGKPSPQTVVQQVPCGIDQNRSSVSTQDKSEADNDQRHEETKHELVFPVSETEKGLQPSRKKLRSTVLTKMENGFQHGPLSILRRSVQEKIKVRVWTRSVRNVRGVSTGYVVAFDKHMNLAMMDVDEIYRKPVGKHQKKSKKPEENVIASMESSPVSGEEVLYPNTPWQPIDTKSVGDTRNSLASDRAGYPDDEDICDNSDRKEVCNPADGIGNLTSAFRGMNVFEDNEATRLLGIKSRRVLTRHLNQVLLRGEHVMAVSLVEPSA